MDESSVNGESAEAPAKGNGPLYGSGSVVEHPQFGVGRIVGFDEPFYVIQFKGEYRKIPFEYRDLKAVHATKDGAADQIRWAVREVLGDYGWIESNFELSPRWQGGTMRLVPGRDGTQPKDIPVDAFVKKVIGVREKLRVLEQKINNHPRLEQADKLELQGYITRAYGSLTTFNVLFAEKESQFKGSGSEE